MEKNPLRIIISGGGTGGHIFPAISIANALRELRPDADILFVGAQGRMEMERVPQAGYRIEGLPVVGLKRKLSLSNITFVFKLMSSLLKARRIVRRFKPQVAVGVGGYASGPTLKAAQRMGLPTLLQEQNSFAGVTNRLLAQKAQRICVAYSGMERYFPADKLMLTGNPVRQDLEPLSTTRAEALQHFDIPTHHRVLLVLGGSLGARTINHSLLDGLQLLAQQPRLTVLWQTGAHYLDEVQQAMASGPKAENIRVMGFVNRMDMAYAAADAVVSRAGAGTISELCLVAKPSILVPSPNVAEDHQTHNARALADRGAAIMVADADAPKQLVQRAIELMNDDAQRSKLAHNAAKLAMPHSARTIAQQVLELCQPTKYSEE